MQRALDETVIEGVKTTIPFHLKLLADPAFVEGRFTSVGRRLEPRASVTPGPSPLYVDPRPRAARGRDLAEILDAGSRGAAGMVQLREKTGPRAGSFRWPQRFARAVGRRACPSSSTTAWTSPSPWTPTASTSARTTCRPARRGRSCRPGMLLGVSTHRPRAGARGRRPRAPTTWRSARCSRPPPSPTSSSWDPSSCGSCGRDPRAPGRHRRHHGGQRGRGRSGRRRRRRRGHLGGVRRRPTPQAPAARFLRPSEARPGLDRGPADSL